MVQQRIGHPTSEHLKEIVSQPGITNVPIRASDVANAKAIFGPQIPGLKGKTTRKKPRGFAVERVSIPDDFYRLNKFVIIAADVMFVAGVPFFVTHLRKIKFTTAEYLPLRTAVQLANSLKKVFYLYARGGFLVRHALMDREFEKVRDLVPLVEVNTTAAREHVAVIERKIRHVKERVRSTTSEYPF